MELIVLKQAMRELQSLPKETIGDIFALFDILLAGKYLSMPISRQLPNIAKGLHELRLSGRAGEFRVYYIVYAGTAIYIIHATPKKTQKIDRRILNMVKARLRSL